VLQHANITRASLTASVTALELVDEAAVALATAQRAHDPALALAAVQKLHSAINATMDLSSSVNATMSILEQTVADQTISMQHLLEHMLGATFPSTLLLLFLTTHISCLWQWH
jgi:acyl CoA:acetate/3-ketoacid CoA transferase